jgi:transcription antitermination protein NusB
VARRKARELAFRTLFQAERGGEDVLEVWRQVQADLNPTPDAEDDDYGDRLDAASVAFAGRLLETFSENRAALDTELEATLQGWSFGQMAQTDLNVLRLALTELRHEADVPKEVTVEMAVRIAKKFGGEESGRFVNGVLARLLRQG